MKAKVNGADVARAAGVSQATVSYVLNKRPDQSIRQETRDRILQAAYDLGYRVNSAARTLATGKTGLVALWLPLSYHSVFNQVAQRIIALAKADGYHVLTMQWTYEPTRTPTVGGPFSAADVDGIIALDARDLVEDILRSHVRHAPIVSIGPAYSEHTDHVGVDLRGGGAAALSHLRDIGCRRIAYACPQFEAHAGEPRYDAYLSACRDKAPILIPLDKGDYEDSHACIRDFLIKAQNLPGGRPDGLYCWNDETAIAALRAAADLGINVPDELAVVGSDGIREAAFSVPTLSTAAQPFDALCATAWQFMQNRLAEPDRPRQCILLPMTLEVRCSTAKHQSVSEV